MFYDKGGLKKNLFFDIMKIIKQHRSVPLKFIFTKITLRKR
nr:MAG TPA: hypothetical protein [Microviridae sp.]